MTHDVVLVRPLNMYYMLQCFYVCNLYCPGVDAAIALQEHCDWLYPQSASVRVRQRHSRTRIRKLIALI